ncbi:hypothetical protein NDU88_003927 [Pleurodeles waltl]|uniref:Uncharacterized protein n=1 Tax=Pleurodeles waltl TaxID=8319 RepID=A0AAV7NL96_PLEWA|nr:hypothetical protein NDU88_003927 [Pleurodeles waltl]
MASSGPGVTVAFRAPSVRLCRQSGHRRVPRRNRPSATPAPASGVPLRRSTSAQLPSAGASKPACGRSSVHSASSPPGRSRSVPTGRKSRVWSAASTPSRVLSLPRHTSGPARPRQKGPPFPHRLSRGSQLRPPFCLRGPDGPRHRNRGCFP